MKEINEKNQKKILLKMLEYIDDICNKNKIQYTLIGGSLIGAIRHSGIIPWDDDIDIIMTYDNYKRFVEIIKKQKNEDYFFMDNDYKNYYYPFGKMIYKKSICDEIGFEKIEDYGLFIDIFTYYPISENKISRYIFYFKMKILKNCIGKSHLSYESQNENFLKLIRYYFYRTIRFINFTKIYSKLYLKNSTKKSKYVISNWPVYGMEKEIQLRNNFVKYKRTKFDNIECSIISNYDDVLKTTFGDYMTPPPVEKQVSKHGLKVYSNEK